MKHLLRLPDFKILLIAGSLFAVMLPLINGCKSTGKTSSTSSAKMSQSMTDTSAMSSDTSGGKQTSGGKDKPPRK